MVAADERKPVEQRHEIGVGDGEVVAHQVVPAVQTLDEIVERRFKLGARRGLCLLGPPPAMHANWAVI